MGGLCVTSILRSRWYDKLHHFCLHLRPVINVNDAAHCLLQMFPFFVLFCFQVLPQFGIYSHVRVCADCCNDMAGYYNITHLFGCFADIVNWNGLQSATLSLVLNLLLGVMVLVWL